ncbi:MAG TPA: hypothetical protein P5262_02900 [Candidatus Moranbacteria bacterium]|nr:hypothetical protein [Candidatus Moranbacteria bacterium]
MNTLRTIFKKISAFEPSIGLEKRIIEKIALQNKLALRRKLAFIYTGFIASSGVFIWAIFTLGKVIYQSAFWDLAALFFSDTGLIIQNWSSFAYSLMETLPIFGIVAILIPIFALFMLISAYFKAINHNHYKFI